MTDIHRMRQVEVAELLGISARQVHNLVKEGMTRHPENGKTFYDGPECVGWFLARKVREAEAKIAPDNELESKARLDNLRSDLLEIELKRAREEVLPVTYSVQQLEGIGERFRAKLLAIAPRWAPMFVGARTIPEMASRVDQAVNDALTVLSAVGEELDEEEAA